MYYSTLKETGAIPDVSDLSGGAVGAVPATRSIHAVHLIHGQVACGYTRKVGDIAEPDRDWFTVPPGEVPCEACLDAIQPDVERRAAR